MADSHVHVDNAKYHLHIDLEPSYAPVQKRRGGSFVSANERNALRCSGAKNVDIWCDGSIYPHDPQTCSQPPFSSPTSLLRFVGDGQKGLLGYCKSISVTPTVEKEMLQVQNTHLCHLRDLCKLQEEKLKHQEQEINKLQKQVEQYRMKKTSIGPRQRKRKLRNVEDLKVGSGGLKKRIKAIR